MDDPLFLALAVATFLAAGTVKGVAGLGMPTTAIGLATLFTEPRSAIALVLFPMIVSNLWQVIRAGDVAGAVRRYAPFALVLIASVWITTALSGAVSERMLMGILGAIIIVFVVINLGIRLPALPDRLDRPAQIAMGLAGGVMGGLTAVWAPAMVIYLAARRVAKDEFVRASGLLIFVGSVPLTAGYALEGHLTGPLALVSAGLILPTILGFSIGERVRRHLSEVRFRQVLLYIFLILGLNLIRRAIW